MIPSYSYYYDPYTFHNAGRQVSKQLYEQEMQHGYIDLGIDKIVMFGIAGSGKTCSLAALLGQSPPDIQCSTPLMERPVQVKVIFVDENAQWQKNTPNQVQQMIAQIIRSRKTTYRVVNTTTNQTYPLLKEYADASASKATPQSSSALLTAQSTLHGTLDSMLASSDFEEEFVKLINNSDPSSEPILRQNWLYIIDSGGQHEFHEVLPIFLNGARLASSMFSRYMSHGMNDLALHSMTPVANPYVSHIPHT